MNRNDLFRKASKLMGSTKKSKKEANGLIAEMKRFSDGKFYAIIKEGSSYVIKVSNTKFPTQTYDFDLIEGWANKGKFVKGSIKLITFVLPSVIMFIIIFCCFIHSIV